MNEERKKKRLIETEGTKEQEKIMIRKKEMME